MEEHHKEEELLTVKELSKYLKVDQMTIYQWANKGVIPSLKAGKQWRFRKSEVDEWMKSIGRKA